MTIQQLAIIIGSALTVITFCTVCYNLFKKFVMVILSKEVEKISLKIESIQKKNEAQFEELKNWRKNVQFDVDSSFEEKRIMMKGVLACLKGLKEQGCNGPVTEAINELECFLYEKAHIGFSQQKE